MNENLKIFFEKATDDSSLKDRIVSLYRKYQDKEKVIEHLIALAAEYDIKLSAEDFVKHSESDLAEAVRYDNKAAAAENIIPEPVTEVSPEKEKKKSFFVKLFEKNHKH